MSDQNTLKDLLEEFHKEMLGFRRGVEREARFSVMPSKIKVAIGMRRVGKTYLLLQKIASLMEEGVPITQILYINFEDDRLLPVNVEKLQSLINQFYTFYPENHEKLCYFFFDEIQNSEGWPLVIRRIFDTKEVQIFLTGSSAKLLSKEISTSLRGRSMATEIWPYSFKEYLLATEVVLPNKMMGQAARDKMMQSFSSYLNEGGFPEALNQDIVERVKLLQNYVRNVSGELRQMSY